MTTRLEKRFGSALLGTVPIKIAGPVPTGKAWNVAAIIGNHTASPSNLSLSISSTAWPSQENITLGTVCTAPAAGNTGPAGVAFSPDGRWVAQVGTSTATTGLFLYSTEGGVLVQTGTTFSTVGLRGLAWSRDSRYVAVVDVSTTTLRVAEVSSTGVPTNVAQQALTVGSSASFYGLEWSADGAYLFVCGNNTPFLAAFPFTGTGIGSKVADPASLPSGVQYNLKLNPAGTYLAGCGSASPYINVWAWTGTAWGTKSSNPGTLPTGNAYALAWAPSGAYIAVAQNATPFGQTYAFSAGTIGTRTTPSPAPSGTTYGEGIIFSAAGTEIYLATDASSDQAIHEFPFAAGTWGLARALTTAPRTTGGVGDTIGLREGALVSIKTMSPYIMMYPALSMPFTTQRLGVVSSAIAIAANTRAKYSGFVLNAGESLIGVASVGNSIDIIASGVEITL